METNHYEYNYQYNKDTKVPWIPQQNQLYEGWYVNARSGQQPPAVQNSRPQQRTESQKPKKPERMSKARALALVRTVKKWLVVASFASFATFSGLVAYHQIGTTATTNSTSSGSSQTTPATNSSSQDANGFLNQQGGNNFGSSNSSQAPVTGSHTS